MKYGEGSYTEREGGNQSSIPYGCQLGPIWAKLGPIWAKLGPIWECCLGSQILPLFKGWTKSSHPSKGGDKKRFYYVLGGGDTKCFDNHV